MLAAEFETLSTRMQDAVLRFFKENELWLAEVLEEGLADGTLRFTGSSFDEGRLILSSLEGAMLVARSFGDLDRFETVAEHLLASLRP